MALSVDLDNFNLTNSWQLHEDLNLAAASIQPMAGRSYPGLKVAAHVERRPMYYFFNVVLPMSTLSLMSNLIFLVPLVDGGSRLEISFGLMLSCVTYKFVINDILPTIAYLTLIDKYVFATVGVVVFNTFSATIVSATVSDTHWTADALTNDMANVVDIGCLALSFFTWTALHLYSACHVHYHYKREERRLDELNDLAAGVSVTGQSATHDEPGEADAIRRQSMNALQRRRTSRLEIFLGAVLGTKGYDGKVFTSEPPISFEEHRKKRLSRVDTGLLRAAAANAEARTKTRRPSCPALTGLSNAVARIPGRASTRGVAPDGRASARPSAGDAGKRRNSGVGANDGRSSSRALPQPAAPKPQQV